MKATYLFIGLVFTLQSFSQYYLKEGYIEMPRQNNIIKPFIYKNLAIYPLLAGEQFSQETKGTADYTTLEEALKTRKVIITETGATGQSGDEVNRLYIENISNDTIFIMAGEVVKGGKQDRVIGDDMILYPKSGRINLDVYCVEHNRWSYKSDHNFGNYYSVSSNSVRKKAVVDKDQSGVWNEVDKVTEKQNAKTSTATYTAISQSDSYKQQLEEYMNYFTSSLNKLPNCIGFVGVSGDKIIGCDIFAGTELFRKQMKNLLNSYITEAITHGSEARPIETSVKKYLDEFLNDKPDQDVKIKEKGVQFEEKGKKLHINTY